MVRRFSFKQIFRFFFPCCIDNLLCCFCPHDETIFTFVFFSVFFFFVSGVNTKIQYTKTWRVSCYKENMFFFMIYDKSILLKTLLQKDYVKTKPNKKFQLILRLCFMCYSRVWPFRWDLPALLNSNIFWNKIVNNIEIWLFPLFINLI